MKKPIRLGVLAPILKLVENCIYCGRFTMLYDSKPVLEQQPDGNYEPQGMMCRSCVLKEQFAKDLEDVAR